MARVRDMTEKQFQAALKRNGFRQLAGVFPYFEDTTGQTPTIIYGGIYVGKSCYKDGSPRYSFGRRTTIAHLIASRADRVKRFPANAVREGAAQ